MGAGVLGLPLATYTAVLISNTAVPVWQQSRRILPLVFGISFQTPLVMIALNRIGMFTAEDYLKKWRYACIILAFFAALITPTPDAVTMLYLFGLEGGSPGQPVDCGLGELHRHAPCYLAAGMVSSGNTR